MKKILMGIAIVALCLTTAKAQGTQFTTAYKCIIANEQCFIVRVGAGGLSATQRVDRLNERLAYILGYERLAPGNIYIKTEKGLPVIYVGRSVLFEVTAADGEANGVKPETLAEAWLANLRHALPQARPPA